MSREKPYRPKFPQSLSNLIQEALSTTFFLVQESGPTSFVLKSETEKLIKVQLGSLHTCSCGGGRLEHCIHTLYVLLKIFRILPDNPILWQLSFIDSEINWLLRNRWAPAAEKKKPLSRKKQVKNKTRIDLEEEYGCAICQDDLLESHSLVYCQVSCGHNFHAKCMKIWADHRVVKGDSVTCPLCQMDWGPSAYRDIQAAIRMNKRKVVVHKNAVCILCGMIPIKGKRFRCLECENVDLCSKCENQHEHYLIVKENTSQPWKGVKNARNLADLEFRALGSQDYHALLELDQVPPLAEFILEILPEGNSAVDLCAICREPKLNTKFKEFPCGHSGHEDCLLDRLREEEYRCPIDNSVFLPGLNVFVPVRLGRKEGLSVAGVPVNRRVAPSTPVRREELMVGGTEIVRQERAPVVRVRPNVRVRTVNSRPLPVPDLMVMGVQRF